MLFDPDPLWQWVAARLDRPAWIRTPLAVAALGGLVVAAATELGVRVFNTDWNYVAGYSAQPERGLGPMAGVWLAAAALPIAQGLGGAWLLPLYGRPRRWSAGVAVGVFGALPIYVAAPALIVLPGIMLVCIAFLVSCAWWGSGARALLGVPMGESADHVAASIIVGAVIVTIVAALVPVF
jgi:hypothetical protein